MTGVSEPAVSNNFVTDKTGLSRNYPEKTVFGENMRDSCGLVRLDRD